MSSPQETSLKCALFERRTKSVLWDIGWEEQTRRR